MSEINNPLGSVFISERAIATIAHQAALESYGVVGLAAKNVVEGLAQVIVREPLSGVDVQYNGEGILIDLYIIVEYGTRIKSVSASVSDSVRYQVEKTVGLPVLQVNIHVRGLRVSNPD